ncbi:MAG TPA: globin-coupled sensor protein [Patescibacteria group bacterium]|nr:globin-coupled sensor protein [Patescibacteria group bacterium]
MTMDFAQQSQQRLKFFGLEGNVLLTLKSVSPILAPAMPEMAQAFYEKLKAWPDLQAMLGTESNIERLKKAQLNHWKTLLTGEYDASYFAESVRVGAAHEQIGLEPLWYLGSYCFMLEKLLDRLIDTSSKTELKARVPAILRAAMLDIELALTSYIKNGESALVNQQMMTLSDVLEREVELTVGEISAQAERLSDQALQLNGIAQHLNAASESVSASVRTTSANVEAVASAATELTASSQEVSGQLASTFALVDEASQRMDQTSAKVGSLGNAADQINGVVRLIQGIAGQTKMLALNATIEAARAGEFGKGFAVVADEVKTLARQTEDGIKGISSQSQQIGRATQEAVDIVGQAAETIHRINAIASHVADATSQQLAATADISRSAVEAADHTRNVAQHADGVRLQAAHTESTAGKVSQLCGIVSHDIGELQTRLSTVLRHARNDSGTEIQRGAVVLKVSLDIAGHRHDGFAIDISPRTVLVGMQLPSDTIGAQGTLTADRLGTLPIKVITVSGLGSHLQFIGFGAVQLDALHHIFQETSDEDNRYGSLAGKVAQDTAARLETVLRNGTISKDDLFDSRYQPIEGTAPQQYLARHTALTDREFPPIMEPVVERDPRIVFCLAVDRNAYIATHNLHCSKPQRPGELDWNTANARNRRIFDDRTGILAARNHDERHVQIYARKITDKETVMLKEYNSPILVTGELWGNVRMAILPK